MFGTVNGIRIDKLEKRVDEVFKAQVVLSRTLTDKFEAWKQIVGDACNGAEEDVVDVEERLSIVARDLADEEVARRERMSDLENRIASQDGTIKSLSASLAELVETVTTLTSKFEETSRGQVTINRMLLEDWVNCKIKVESPEKVTFKDIDGKKDEIDTPKSNASIACGSSTK